jgi:hypothetical protein
MRLLIAGIAALAAVSFAAPSFAQEATDAAPVATPTPTVKHKPGTSAYCNSLKSSTQRSSCLKRIQTAKATKPAHPAKTKKPAPAAAATSADSSAPTPAPTPAPAQMSAPSNGSSVAVPPLPQKTI